MRRLASRREEALTTGRAVEQELRTGEEAFTFLSRQARRDLVIDPAGGPPRLAVQQGRFDGYVRLSRGDRELYLNAPALTADAAARLVDAGRRLLPLGVVRASPAEQILHEGEWSNRETRAELEPVALDTSSLLAAVSEGAGPAHTVQALTVSEVLSEQVYTDSAGPRATSLCCGVEVTAHVADDDSGTAARVTRYAAGLEGVDLVALGHEAGLTATALAPAALSYSGYVVDLLPSAAAQLLRALAGALLFNPIGAPGPLPIAVVDDGRAAGGCSARAFDCEGTATGVMELVSRRGEQRTLVARRTRAAGTDHPRSRRLTGHAAWEARRYQPRPSATNVHLTPTDLDPDLGDGRRCLVTDVRSLGAEEFRSGGQLAFRLRAVRAVDGRPAGTYAPLVVQGEAAHFLAALTGVGRTVSYYPGPFSVGGAALSMDMSRLPARNEV